VIQLLLQLLLLLITVYAFAAMAGETEPRGWNKTLKLGFNVFICCAIQIIFTA